MEGCVQRPEVTPCHQGKVHNLVQHETLAAAARATCSRAICGTTAALERRWQLKCLILPCSIFECMEWCCCRVLRKRFCSSICVSMQAWIANDVCVYLEVRKHVRFNIPHDVCMPCTHVKYACILFCACARTAAKKL